MTDKREEDMELQLCRYLDGDMSRRERAAMEKRLASDEALREELRRYAALEGYLADMQGGDLPGVDYDLQRAEIVAAVERKALLAPQRRRTILFRPAFRLTAAAAALLLVAAAAWVALNWGDGGRAESRIIVEIHPVSPRQAAPAGEVFVQLSAPDPTAPGVWPPDPEPAGAAPDGTVVVSVGSGGARAGGSDDSIVVY